MNILFLVSSMEGGGAERVAALLSNAWVARGDNVTLMPTFSGRGGVSYPLSAGVDLHFLADDVGGNTGRVARIKALRKFIVKMRPDVIISFLPHVNIAALMAAWGTGVPVVACERTFPPMQHPPLPLSYRILRYFFYRKAALLVGQSDEALGWFAQHFNGVPTAKVLNYIEVPLPISNQNIMPKNALPPDKEILLSVGRLVRSKRHHILIDAFARIAKTRLDWDLVILGEGEERPALEAQIKNHALEGRVHLLGRVGNLDDWYRRAAMFCLASSYEGFPNALLEAMGYGLPSIAFDIKTGPRDIMDGGRMGVLLPDDAHEKRLSEALSNLMNDPDQRLALAAHAPEIRQTYSMDAILKMWDKAMAMAISSSDAPKIGGEKR